MMLLKFIALVKVQVVTSHTDWWWKNMNSRALIKGFFDSRSVSGPSITLVNHQLGSFNDFLPHDKNQAPWMPESC